MLFYHSNILQHIGSHYSPVSVANAWQIFGKLFLECNYQCECISNFLIGYIAQGKMQLKGKESGQYPCFMCVAVLKKL